MDDPSSTTTPTLFRGRRSSSGSSGFRNSVNSPSRRNIPACRTRERLNIEAYQNALLDSFGCIPNENVVCFEDRMRVFFGQYKAIDLIPLCSKAIILDTRLHMHTAISSLKQFGCNRWLCNRSLNPQSHEGKEASHAHKALNPSMNKNIQCCENSVHSKYCCCRGIWMYCETQRRVLGRLDALDFSYFMIVWYKWMCTSANKCLNIDVPLNALSNHTAQQNEIKNCTNNQSCVKQTEEKGKEQNKESGDTENSVAGKSDLNIDIPPYTMTIEGWRKRVEGQLKPLIYISPDCSAVKALNLLVQNSQTCGVKCICLMNEDCHAPLGLISARSFLVHTVQYLRGHFLDFECPVKDLQLGTFTDIITVPVDTSLLCFLEKIRETGHSSLPLVDAQGKYLGCFSADQFFVLLLKHVHDGVQINLEDPILGFWEEVKKLQCQHSIPGAAAVASNPAASVSAHLLMSGHPNRHMNYGYQEDRHFTWGATVSNEAEPLRDIILRILLSAEERAIFLDGEGRIYGIVTAMDVCRFFVSGTGADALCQDDLQIPASFSPAHTFGPLLQSGDGLWQGNSEI